MKALASLPDETVIEGEVVALDESGRPSFNILQNHGSSGAPIIYYAFDVLILAGLDVMAEPLSVRRGFLGRLGEQPGDRQIRVCPACKGSTTVRSAPDPQARKLLLEMTRMIGKGAAVQIVQNFGGASLDQTMAKMPAMTLDVTAESADDEKAGEW